MIEYAIISEKGDRENNEDSLKICMNKRLSTYGFVLADGLGGHGHGDVASSFVVNCIEAAIYSTDNTREPFIDDCFRSAQRLLLEEKERTGLYSIKTTLVLLLITDKFAQWGHIGDSRLYHFRDGKVLSRTLDHSMPQVLVSNGKIKEREIRHHPDRGILLHAMGSEWEEDEYEIDKRIIRVRKGDSFLLCSDGFWDWIDERAMLKILKKNMPTYDALKHMSNEVYSNGFGKDMDNYSAILVNIK